MRRNSSSSNDDHGKTSRHSDRNLHRREIEKKEERRRRWMLEQEKLRQHERLKKKMIEEYERKRKALKREQELQNLRRCSHRSESRHSSSSPVMLHSNNEPKIDPSRTPVMSQKIESPNNSEKLFKGPEGLKIDSAELHRIKVNIHRKISDTETNTEIHRDIVHPEDIQVKRREGEGSKPIFERLKETEVQSAEVEEHRTVIALDDPEKDNKACTSKKRSVSPRSSTKRPSSRRRTEERESRYECNRQDEDRLRDHSSHRRESEKHRDRSDSRANRHEMHDYSRSARDITKDRRDRRNRSHSVDQESRRGELRNRSDREIASHRDRRERSRVDSRDRRYREDRSRERRIHESSHHYADAMPVPMYYDAFHPRPIMVSPMMPIRGQIPLPRGRMPPVMGPMRPYLPRFLPPDMYRPTLHPNPRFNRMF